jgi:hypothetical protein
MDRELAKHVANIALASRGYLDTARYALEKHCSPAELSGYQQAITNAAGCIDREILSKLYATFPNLQDELEDRIKKYGRPV